MKSTDFDFAAEHGTAEASPPSRRPAVRALSYARIKVLMTLVAIGLFALLVYVSAINAGLAH
jgi:hypothetical protein